MDRPDVFCQFPERARWGDQSVHPQYRYWIFRKGDGFLRRGRLESSDGDLHYCPDDEWGVWNCAGELRLRRGGGSNGCGAEFHLDLCGFGFGDHGNMLHPGVFPGYLYGADLVTDPCFPGEYVVHG